MKEPRSIAAALRRVREQTAPETLLAAVQAAWRDAAGERIATEARPVLERGGAVTIACHAATWAHELDLHREALLARLNADREVAARGGVSALRFTADAARYDDTLS